MSESHINDPKPTPTKAELIESMKAAFDSLISDVLIDAKGDVGTTRQLITQEYGRYLWRAVHDGDMVAADNLKDLRAQILLIAAKLGIVAARETTEKLVAIAIFAAQFGVRVLLGLAL